MKNLIVEVIAYAITIAIFLLALTIIVFTIAKLFQWIIG